MGGICHAGHDSVDTLDEPKTKLEILIGEEKTDFYQVCRDLKLEIQKTVCECATIDEDQTPELLKPEIIQRHVLYCLREEQMKLIKKTKDLWNMQSGVGVTPAEHKEQIEEILHWVCSSDIRVTSQAISILTEVSREYDRLKRKLDSDIFSLGLVIHKFYGPSAFEIFNSVCTVLRNFLGKQWPEDDTKAGIISARNGWQWIRLLLINHRLHDPTDARIWLPEALMHNHPLNQVSFQKLKADLENYFSRQKAYPTLENGRVLGLGQHRTREFKILTAHPPPDITSLMDRIRYSIHGQGHKVHKLRQKEAFMSATTGGFPPNNQAFSRWNEVTPPSRRCKTTDTLFIVVPPIASDIQEEMARIRGNPAYHAAYSMIKIFALEFDPDYKLDYTFLEMYPEKTPGYEAPEKDAKYPIIHCESEQHKRYIVGADKVAERAREEASLLKTKANVDCDICQNSIDFPCDLCPVKDCQGHTRMGDLCPTGHDPTFFEIEPGLYRDIWLSKNRTEFLEARELLQDEIYKINKAYNLSTTNEEASVLLRKELTKRRILRDISTVWTEPLKSNVWARRTKEFITITDSQEMKKPFVYILHRIRCDFNKRRERLNAEFESLMEAALRHEGQHWNWMVLDRNYHHLIDWMLSSGAETRYITDHLFTNGFGWKWIRLLLLNHYLNDNVTFQNLELPEFEPQVNSLNSHAITTSKLRQYIESVERNFAGHEARQIYYPMEHSRLLEIRGCYFEGEAFCSEPGEFLLKDTKAEIKLEALENSSLKDTQPPSTTRRRQIVRFM